MFGGTGFVPDGGTTWPTPLGDTWVWRNGGWTQLSGSWEFARSMVYDPANRTVVGFGGFDPDRVLFGSKPGPGTTYVWNGQTWSAPPLANQPTARQNASFVYDPQLHGVVMFGGVYSYDKSYFFNDTWLWNGHRWRRLKAQSKIAPSPRFDANMVYDAATHQVVLFGGSGPTSRDTCCTYLNDTWVLSRAGWQRLDAGGLTSHGPSARISPSMAYDSARGRVVLFGGRSPRVEQAGSFDSLIESPLNDTWTWDGKRWSDAPLTDAVNAPSPRSGATMVYDDARKELVLFGGFSYATVGTGCTTCDTWSWNGKGWRRTSTTGPSVPTAVDGVSQDFPQPAAYDAATRQIITVTPPASPCGGVETPGCGSKPPITWLWDGKSWHQQASPRMVSADVGGPMVYDAAHRHVVMLAVGEHATWTW
jgi:hypothetical protein